MNPAIFIAIFLPLLVIFIEQANVKKRVAAYRAVKRRNQLKGENRNYMNELIQKYIGKECLIYTMNSQVTGTVKSLNENWLEIEGKDSSDVINIDYIIRIREYPRNKNGKKKQIVAD